MVYSGQFVLPEQVISLSYKKEISWLYFHSFRCSVVYKYVHNFTNITCLHFSNWNNSLEEHYIQIMHVCTWQLIHMQFMCYNVACLLLLLQAMKCVGCFQKLPFYSFLKERCSRSKVIINLLSVAWLCMFNDSHFLWTIHSDGQTY